MTLTRHLVGGDPEPRGLVNPQCAVGASNDLPGEPRRRLGLEDRVRDALRDDMPPTGFLGDEQERRQLLVVGDRRVCQMDTDVVTGDLLSAVQVKPRQCVAIDR